MELFMVTLDAAKEEAQEIACLGIWITFIPSTVNLGNHRTANPFSKLTAMPKFDIRFSKN
jgi:hypothetical protein